MSLEYIKVYISSRDCHCEECQEHLAERDFLFLRKDWKPICLTCADLDHLIYLPAGDTAITRRAAQYSTLRAVVLKFSKKRKRNERQGVLVEELALEKAEQECKADSEARARQRERAAERRAKLDREYVRNFAEHIRKLYPYCPAGTETEIAEHACLKYSDRVGRSNAAKSFEENAVKLAVIAHVRHNNTAYDSLLAKGYEKFDAREMISDAIQKVLSKWRSNE